MLIGTTVNALAILIGSAIGIGITQFATRLPTKGSGDIWQRLQDIVMKGVALCVLYIGISGCLQGQNTLIVILSIVLGALLGEILNLDQKMQGLGDWVQKKTARLSLGGTSSVSDGFVTSSLLFCVGAMAVVGPLQDGLTGDHSTLFAKSLLDFISAMIFASSLGIGVAFSAVAVFLYQGTIAVLASLVSPLLSTSVIAEMTCVGSLLIIALALNMLGVLKIKVMNLTPSCLLPILLCKIYEMISIII